MATFNINQDLSGGCVTSWGTREREMASGWCPGSVQGPGLDGSLWVVGWGRITLCYIGYCASNQNVNLPAENLYADY